MAAKTTTITCGKLTMATLFAVALQITGLILFVVGFFPVKPSLSAFSGPESYFAPGNEPPAEDFNVTAMSSHQLRSLYQELSQIPASYSRLILMVIDGLPAEFVLGKDGKPPSKDFVDAMPYTQSLLANGKAIGYHAKAAPPTVTMPRLKAMVSGAIGGFLDVAFNFNTQAFLDDNLLGQLFKIGWKMTMFGDETWLKLFPHLFSKKDGVSSFFVKDTIQVDRNVSRHLPEELHKDDWDLLILHYLGLDHVGHIGGRKSVLMASKLKEMDDILEMIYLNSVRSLDSKPGDTLLVVVSDHGMTDGGNHGGSSYEETDALAIFMGPKFNVTKNQVSAFLDTVNQVDLASTLALLLGVPIPKNNVGVVARDCLLALKDEEQLRALELNSWQLLRLLKAQLPRLSCAISAFPGPGDDQWSELSHCNSTIEEIFCCLYYKAVLRHNVWKHTVSRSKVENHYNSTVTAYYDFLIASSDWLTRRVTDKPIGLLAFGILAMVLSCVVFLRLLYCLRREEVLKWNQKFVGVKHSVHDWSLEELFVAAVVVILVVSMGSSSMVEEEQYIWYFMMSTLFWILLRRAIKFVPIEEQSGPKKSDCVLRYSLVCPILVMLLSGRIIRAWHQGGVNWIHLPDISKWLEKAGNDWVKATGGVSVILVISLSIIAFSKSRLNRCFIIVLQILFLLSGYLVLQHVMNHQDNTLLTSGHGATFQAQLIYTLLSIVTCFSILATPWLSQIPICGEPTSKSQLSPSAFVKDKLIYLSAGSNESSYLIGCVYMLAWSLLQLLLQQPINSLPVIVLLVQITVSMIYFVGNGASGKPWVEVAALYFMGMVGHFGLGNTNTLATVDVAGAFIGISSHSTVLSGILMFCITYASPMLALLSLLMYISMKDETCSGDDDAPDFGVLLKSALAIPLLVPLAINSVLLAAYTVVLLQMRSHLFIWSVFSPKYLYVCATTACVYIGVLIVAATQTYISLVSTFRAKRLLGTRNSAVKPQKRS